MQLFEKLQKILLPFGDSRMGSQWMKYRHTKDERRVPVYEFCNVGQWLVLYEDRDRWRVLAATAEDYRWIRNEPWDRKMTTPKD